MGTGEALYALASQNLPSIRIAIGTRDALPSADNLSRATARGSASFFLGAFRSPGVICGRPSCAAATDPKKNDPKNEEEAPRTTKSAPQYKILEKQKQRPDAGLAAFNLGFS
jgi:hypothetical protein